MTSDDLARIEPALTDEVLDVVAEAWADARHCGALAGAARREAIDILMDAIRRAFPADEARTCAPTSDILTPEEFACCLDALERDVRLTNHREPKDVLQAHDAALRAALDAEEARLCCGEPIGRWPDGTA